MSKLNCSLNSKEVIGLFERFFQIVILPQLSKTDRIKSEWVYFLSLLGNENVQMQRIDVYLNIIDSSIRNQVKNLDQQKQNMNPYIPHQGRSKNKYQNVKRDADCQKLKNSLYNLTKKIQNLFESKQKIVQIMHKNIRSRQNSFKDKQRAGKRYTSLYRNRY